MTVILQGSLRHFPPWQLLPFLACSVDLATLQVEGSTPARLWLRGGRAVWGESPAGNDVVSAAAAIMQCPIGTVRSRVHRGRKQMRKQLGVS